MSELPLGPQDCLFYEYREPQKVMGCTFVFFNALTGDISSWEDVIGPMVRKKGHGTLVYNIRGQSHSRFSQDVKLDSDLIVKDAGRLLEQVKPVRPVFVGFSIGGLFAVRAWLAGARPLGLVLINTLHRNGPRLQWITDAMVRAAGVGGLDLFRDLYLPLLMNERWQAANRPNFLSLNLINPLQSIAAITSYWRRLAGRRIGRSHTKVSTFLSLWLPVFRTRFF